MNTIVTTVTIMSSVTIVTIMTTVTPSCPPDSRLAGVSLSLPPAVLSVVAGVVSVQRGALAAVHTIAVVVIVTIDVATISHGVTIVETVLTIGAPIVSVSVTGRVAVGPCPVSAGVPVLYARHPGAVVVTDGLARAAPGPRHHVVPVHVVALRHAGRLAVGPRARLRFGWWNWLVDGRLGRRQWLVVRVPVGREKLI